MFRISQKKQLNFFYLIKFVCFHENKISKYFLVTDYHEGRGCKNRNKTCLAN